MLIPGRFLGKASFTGPLADTLLPPRPSSKHLDEGGEVLLVSWAGVEPGEIQPIKAMGPQKWGH